MGNLQKPVPTNVMKLRGGMSLGPITPGNFNGALKVAAAVTAAGAITEKYAGLEGTTVTNFFKGDVWTTNLVISLVTGAASTVIYSVGESAFASAKVASVLWCLSVLVKFKDANFDLSSLANDPIEGAVAVISTLLAWA